MKHNITLSIDKDILKKVKVFAAERDISVSKLLSLELQRMIENREFYEYSKKKAIEEMDKALDISSFITWTRDELHE